jgi:hypothetical protein
MTERYRRVSFGRIDLQVTLSDPGLYARPWTIPVRVALAADTELLEYVCNENETRRTNLVGRTDAEKRLVVPSETLTEYVGTYVTNPAGPSALSLTVRLRGGELFLDMNGKGNIPLVPLSPTTFSIRLANFEFFRNDRGEVAGMVDNQGGVRFTRQSP